MTKSAQTLFVWGIYLLALGLVVLIAPNTVLGFLAIPATTEVWIRVAGMMVFFLGCYDVVGSRANSLPILELSVRLRILAAACFAGFVALGWAPTPLLIFGGVDLAGALWTHLTLRRELGGKAATSPPPTAA